MFLIVSEFNHTKFFIFILSVLIVKGVRMIDWSLVIISTIIIEIITLFGRFVFKKSSKENYFKILKKLNARYFIHFHHGFFGVIILLVSYFYGFVFLFNLGIGFILSDLVHHFVILWSITGSPEFHLIYKNDGL